MIKVYDDFILESRISNMILEKKLIASDSFMSRLQSISSNSEVASILHYNFALSKNIKSDISQNYIDVTDTNDMISFLPDSKVDDSDYGFKLTVFSEKGRGQIKIGRFARAFFKNKDILSAIKKHDAEIAKEFTDSDYEKFVNLFKASFKADTDIFKLVSGDDIQKYYSKDTYAGRIGTLGNSCMNGDDCSTYFDIYTENSDKCQMLCYFDENNYLMGRALVWKLDNEIEGCKYFMDRVYTLSDSDVIKFINYAIKENWLYKWRMSYEDVENIVFRKGNDFIIENVTIKMDYVKFDEYPFMDTFSYIDLDNKLVSNVAFTGCISCTETDGSYSHCYSCNGDGRSDSECTTCDGCGSLYCEHCNEGVIECDSCYQGYTKCDNCNGTSTVYDDNQKCKNCDGKGYNKTLIRGVKTCKTCSGTGDLLVKCSECNKGSVVCPECTGDYESKCEECGGKYETNCTECEGSGIVYSKCEECSGAYETHLNTLVDYRDPTVSEMAREILNKIKKT